MKRRLRIYIAGPYTKGDTAFNVREAVLVASELWNLGYAPFVPHLTHFWHMLDPHVYEAWIAYDLEWLSVCDVLWRIPGESNGADREVARARELNIPVVTSLDQLNDVMERLR